MGSKLYVKKTKRIAVLFSSGLDSTYLVYKNLEEGHIVQPIYVDIKNNRDKVAIEKQNMFMLYEIFHEQYGYNIEKPIIITEVNVNTSNHTLSFKQLPIWIFSISYLGDGYDAVQIAYVSNDDAISFLDDIKKFYKSHRWLFLESKQAKLEFPLIKMGKYQLIQKLPSKYKPYISSCEAPELLPYFMKVGKRSIDRLQFYKPCGYCHPCKRIIHEDNAYNDMYERMVKDYHQKHRLGEEFFRYKEVNSEKFEEVLNTLRYPDISGIKAIV